MGLDIQWEVEDPVTGELFELATIEEATAKAKEIAEMHKGKEFVPFVPSRMVVLNAKEEL